MNRDKIAELMTRLHRREVSVDQALDELKILPLENIGFARIDHHRALRRGQPEVIYGPGKTTEQIIQIARRIRQAGTDVIISRVDEKTYTRLKKRFKTARFFGDAGLVLILAGRKKESTSTTEVGVLVCSAGTSDIPVAEEAALTAWILGCPVERLYDVGVAGIHRLFDEAETLRRAGVIIVVAGMEGALPSVIGGLVDTPVIAVPTSVGYGASFGGLAALLGMLNSCASGLTVVNIDNGFGAGVAAATIAVNMQQYKER